MFRKIPALVQLLLLLAVAVGTDVQAQQQPEVKQGEYFGAMSTDYPGWFKASFLDLQEDVAEAAALERKVLVLFSQDNCPYCHALINQVYADSSAEAYLRAHFDVIHINIWGDLEVITVDGETLTEEQFARALDVQFTPTTLILDNAGKPVRRINGYRGKTGYLLPLRYAAEAYDNGTSYEEFRATREPQGEGIPEIMQAYLTKDSEIPVDSYTAVMLVDRQCRECEPVAELMRDPKIAGQLKLLDLKVVDIEANPDIVAGKRRIPLNRILGDDALAHAPTVVILDENAREVIRMDAFFKSFHFSGVLEYVIDEEFLDEPSFQRYLSARADAIRETGEDVNIWE